MLVERESSYEGEIRHATLSKHKVINSIFVTVEMTKKKNYIDKLTNMN